MWCTPTTVPTFRGERLRWSWYISLTYIPSILQIESHTLAQLKMILTVAIDLGLMRFYAPWWTRFKTVGKHILYMADAWYSCHKLIRHCVFCWSEYLFWGISTMGYAVESQLVVLQSINCGTYYLKIPFLHFRPLFATHAMPGTNLQIHLGNS